MLPKHFRFCRIFFWRGVVMPAIKSVVNYVVFFAKPLFPLLLMRLWIGAKYFIMNIYYLTSSFRFIAIIAIPKDMLICNKVYLVYPSNTFL